MAHADFDLHLEQGCAKCQRRVLRLDAYQKRMARPRAAVETTSRGNLRPGVTPRRVRIANQRRMLRREVRKLMRARRPKAKV